MSNLKIVLTILFAVLGALFAAVYFPKESDISAEPTPTHADTKVTIVPTFGLPSSFLADIKATLESRHDFNVIVSTHLGENNKFYFPKSTQYDALKLAQHADKLRQRWRSKNCFIVLTGVDINYINSGFRFAF